MPPNQTSTADGQPAIACPTISKPKRRRRSMGEISATKTEREFNGVSIVNTGTSSHKINQNKQADGVRSMTITRPRQSLPGKMKTIPETSEQECTESSSENIRTTLHSKKLAEGVKTTPRRQSTGNLKTVMETNDPNVVPNPYYAFYGEGREPECHALKIELVLTKLKLKPQESQHVQESLDAELEALIHDFPNQTKLHQNKQKRRSSLSIKQDSKEQLFDIDYIAGERNVDNEIEYFVKWTGFALEDSSWVPERDVHARETIEFFRKKNAAYLVIKQKLHDDQKSFTPFVLNKYDKRFHKRWELLEKELNWNTISGGKAPPIFIENWSNKVQSLPDFEYIVENRHSDEVLEALRNLGPKHLEQDLGCDEGCECRNAKNCCAKYYKGRNYRTNSKGISTIRLKKPGDGSIVECGEHCKCDPQTCHQRVLQKGRKVLLALFWEGAKGWGLRTIEKIRRNAFVGEYMGEVISETEAESSKRSTAYQFQLSTVIPTLNNKRLVIDATNFGNETRFINHSCKPNLMTISVVTNKYSSYDSRIGFYSTRDIEPGEELTFDYFNRKPKQGELRVKCRCGEEGCRSWLPARL